MRRISVLGLAIVLTGGAVFTAGFADAATGSANPVLDVHQAYYATPLDVSAAANNSTAPAPITDYIFDFGDGTAPVDNTPNGKDPAYQDHTYQTPGSYSVTLTIKDSAGDVASVTQRITVRSTYVPLTPVRILDTRNGTGTPLAKLGANGTLHKQVTGVGGVPTSGVTAVVLNVTVADTTASSSVTVYPDGTALPAVSNLTFRAGQAIPNLVTVRVGSNGKVDFYNKTGSIDVFADVQGYYTNTNPNQEFYGGFLVPTAPTRVLDTRNGTGAAKAKVGPGGSVTVKVSPSSVPVDEVTAVALTVTATNPTAESFLTIYPNLSTRPWTSNLNFLTGQTISNLVVVPVQDGKAVFYNRNGSVDLIADVTGYVDLAQAGAGPFTPLAPARVLDTRNGIGVPKAKLGPNASLALQVGGVAGVPAGVTAVLLNVTAANGSTASYLTGYPDGSAVPVAYSMNFPAGQTMPNLVLVQVAPNGKVDFYNKNGTVDVIADVFGFFTTG